MQGEIILFLSYFKTMFSNRYFTIFKAERKKKW